MRARSRLALVLSSLLVVGTSCFQPVLTPCHVLCDEDHACPRGYECSGDGVCLQPGGQCPGVNAAADAAVDAAADAAVDAAADAAVDAGFDRAGIDLAVEVAADARSMFCFEGECLEPGALVSRLSLWVDPSTLPRPGQEVLRWRDRSSEANDLTPLGTPPRVRMIKDQSAVAFASLEMLAAPSRPSLDLGAENVVALVVASLVPAETNPTCLLSKGTTQRDQPRVQLAARLGGESPTARPQIRLGTASGQTYWVPAMRDDALADGALHLLVMRRAGDLLELRIDGSVHGQRSLPAHTLASNEAPLWVGTCNAEGSYFHGSIAAVAILPGVLSEEELKQVEAFFLRAYVGR